MQGRSTHPRRARHRGNARHFFFYRFDIVMVDNPKIDEYCSPKKNKHRSKIDPKSKKNDQKSMPEHRKSGFAGPRDPSGGSWGHFAPRGGKKKHKKPKSSYGESSRIAMTSSPFPKKLPKGGLIIFSTCSGDAFGPLQPVFCEGRAFCCFSMKNVNIHESIAGIAQNHFMQACRALF